MLFDVHTHVSPKEFPASQSEAIRSRWPCMQCKGQSGASLYFGDTLFRELDDRSWDCGRRIEDMDRDGVAVQVLSPMPELLSYWLPANDAQILCDLSNAQITEMISLHPNRFRGLGAVPVQDLASAVAGLKRIKSEFGLSGVQIGSNINGVALGDPSLEPFFAAAEDIDLAIFVHALHPVVGKVTSMSPQQLALVGFPLDVALALSSLILSGTLERHPRLRIAFSHGGGAIGSMLGRLDEGWRRTSGFGGKMIDAPSEQARHFFYDSNVYDRAYLQHLISETAPKHVFMGTDYPYPIMQEKPAAFLAQLDISDEERQALEYGAARTFLGDDLI